MQFDSDSRSNEALMALEKGVSQVSALMLLSEDTRSSAEEAKNITQDLHVHEHFSILTAHSIFFENKEGGDENNQDTNPRSL